VITFGDIRAQGKEGAMRQFHERGGAKRTTGTKLKSGLAVTTACAMFLFVGLQSAAGGSGTVTCTDAFSGTARNVVVPADNFCALAGATITHDVLIGERGGAGAGGFDNPAGLRVGHDVIVQEGAEVDFGPLGATLIGHDLSAGTGASLHIENTTIRHDLRAYQPGTLQTGALRVGHDLSVEGTPPGNEFVFDSVCGATVGHDLRFTNRSVTLGFTIGDEEACGNSGNAIGQDLVVTGNSALSGFFGPSAIEVGNNTVGHNLVFTNNTAVAGGYLEVADNSVRHDAICAGNNPAPSADDPADGPNLAGHTNTCG
jgi:hypothetical protein